MQRYLSVRQNHVAWFSTLVQWLNQTRTYMTVSPVGLEPVPPVRAARVRLVLATQQAILKVLTAGIPIGSVSRVVFQLYLIESVSQDYPLHRQYLHGVQFCFGEISNVERLLVVRSRLA